jgi:hypothetical protein
VIGRKREPPAPSTAGSDDGQAADPVAETKEVPAQSHRRLGVIGKKPGAAPSSSSSTKPVGHDSTDRGRQRQVSAEVDRPRETSEERADRRREELKKELEKKAAAGPAKKKRRF